MPAIGSAPDTPRVPIFAVTCSTDDELWQRPVLHDRCASPAARAGDVRPCNVLHASHLWMQRRLCGMRVV